MAFNIKTKHKALKCKRGQRDVRLENALFYRACTQRNRPFEIIMQIWRLFSSFS